MATAKRERFSADPPLAGGPLISHGSDPFMLSRLSVSSALVACVVAVVALLRAEPPADSLVRRVYPVADLVAPLPEMKINAECAKVDKPEKSRPTREDWLIEQLLNTVQPASWAAHDGAGTVDYFPMAACLIVNQTPEGQKQVADRLAELRAAARYRKWHWKCAS